MSVTKISESPWGTTPRKRGNKYSEKKEAVLTAAAALIRRNGYEGTSLNELAEMLNITKPTLYYYVGGKEELYAAIIERGQTHGLEFIKKVASQDLSGLEKLRSILIMHAELMNSDFGACLMVKGPRDIDPSLNRKIRAMEREGNDLIYQILEQGKKDGTLHFADATVALYTMFGSLNWMPVWFTPNGRLTLRKAAEIQVQLLLDGLRAK